MNLDFPDSYSAANKDADDATPRNMRAEFHLDSASVTELRLPWRVPEKPRALHWLRVSEQQHLQPVTWRALRLPPVSLPAQVIAQERQVMLQARWRPVLADFLLCLEQLWQYRQDPAPSVLRQAIAAGQKRNHEERSAANPIWDEVMDLHRVRGRDPRKRNRGEAAGCDNRCSRSPHKPGGLAGPFRMQALDKCQCPPRPFAD